MITDTETPPYALSPAALRTELIARAMAHHLGTDADHTGWLACVVAVHGWPDRRLVRHDGALAALVLAAHASVEYQASWRAKLDGALRAGTVDADAAGALLASITAKRDTGSTLATARVAHP